MKVIHSYPFQDKGVRKIRHFGWRALLADEMGLGKTRQALLAVKELLNGKPKPIVVVCPKTIKENWKREARIHIGMRATVLEKMKPPKTKLQVSPDRFFIINYDILGAARKVRGTWMRWLRSLKPKCIIIDEAHYIKSPKAGRTKSVKELCRGVKHVIAISGTPLTSRPVELWPVINLLRPDVFNSFLPYGLRYCGGRRGPFGWDFRGATKLKELHRKLQATCMIRRLKKDVMSQLPTKTRTVINVEIQRPREYKLAESDFVKWLAKKSKRKALRAAKAQELVKLGYLKRLAGELKLKAVIEWINNYLESTNEKLLVFGIHKNVLHTLHQRFNRLAVLVDGGVTGSKRQSAIDRFNRDKRTRLMFGNIQAAGVGWSCTCASNVLMVELDWVPGNHRQAEDRIHGIGRGTGAANIYYLVATGTIEQKICRILEAKQGTLDSTLDGKKIVKSLDIYAQLEKQYLKVT